MRTPAPFALPTLFLLACTAVPNMHVDATTVTTGTDVVVNVDSLDGTALYQYWIALQPAAMPSSRTDGRILLERPERVVHLRTSAPGDFEVRLHARYPSEEHHLVARVPVTIVGWPAQSEPDSQLEPRRCYEHWLAVRGLVTSDIEADTAQMGGTPLYDPVTGEPTSRWESVASLHPDALRACVEAGREATWNDLP